MTATTNPTQGLPSLAEIGKHLSDREVEQATDGRLKRRTLQYWRLIGEGPKYVRIGRRCLYHPDEISAFVAGGMR